jgi:hypothetical protein
MYICSYSEVHEEEGAVEMQSREEVGQPQTMPRPEPEPRSLKKQQLYEVDET